MRSDGRLDAYFGALPPNSLTRFNLFQALAVNRFTGQLDFGPIDAVFAAAEAHDQMLLPVLAPQDGACEDEVFKGRQWYVDGWTEFTPGHERVVMSYRDWMHTAVARYRNSPSLAAWSWSANRRRVRAPTPRASGGPGRANPAPRRCCATSSTRPAPNCAPSTLAP